MVAPVARAGDLCIASTTASLATRCWRVALGDAGRRRRWCRRPASLICAEGVLDHRAGARDRSRPPSMPSWLTAPVAATSVSSSATMLAMPAVAARAFAASARDLEGDGARSPRRSSPTRAASIEALTASIVVRRAELVDQPGHGGDPAHPLVEPAGAQRRARRPGGRSRPSTSVDHRRRDSTPRSTSRRALPANGATRSAVLGDRRRGRRELLDRAGGLGDGRGLLLDGADVDVARCAPGRWRCRRAGRRRRRAGGPAGAATARCRRRRRRALRSPGRRGCPATGTCDRSPAATASSRSRGGATSSTSASALLARRRDRVVRAAARARRPPSRTAGRPAGSRSSSADTGDVERVREAGSGVDPAGGQSAPTSQAERPGRGRRPRPRRAAGTAPTRARRRRLRWRRRR